jgi:hypothetical protein
MAKKPSNANLIRWDREERLGFSVYCRNHHALCVVWSDPGPWTCLICSEPMQKACRPEEAALQ